MRDKTLVRFRQFDFTIFPQNEKYKYCSKYSRYCHQEEYIVYHLVLLPSLQMREHIMQMHVDFSFYQAIAFQVLILIPYKQNVAQAYKVRILFAKDFFGVKNAPPKVLHFCPTFGVHFIHGAAIPVAAKSARQDKHRLQKQPTKCVHAICKFSLKYAKRMLLHRLKCNVQSSIFIILYPMPT